MDQSMRRSVLLRTAKKTLVSQPASPGSSLARQFRKTLTLSKFSASTKRTRFDGELLAARLKPDSGRQAGDRDASHTRAFPASSLKRAARVEPAIASVAHGGTARRHARILRCSK